jgi:putative spermidine/putrescine transport system permease protein
VKPKDTERIGQLVSYGYVLAVSVFLLVPFMVTVIRSVTYSLPDGTTTVGLKPYFDIMGSFWPKVYLSLSIAVTTIMIDTAVGIPAAYALVRYAFPGKRALYTLLNGVWYVPGICYALSLILAYYFLYKWALGYWGFIAAYSAGFLLLMLMTCIVAFKYVDPCYEESASCLGAGRLTTFFKVTMPLIGPGVSAGILLIFVLSFNEFITALLLNLPTKLMTAPVRVFAEITRARATPYIAAEAAVLQLISLAVVVVYLRIVGTKYLRGVVLV